MDLSVKPKCRYNIDGGPYLIRLLTSCRNFVFRKYVSSAFLRSSIWPAMRCSQPNSLIIRAMPSAVKHKSMSQGIYRGVIERRTLVDELYTRIGPIDHSSLVTLDATTQIAGNWQEEENACQTNQRTMEDCFKSKPECE